MIIDPSNDGQAKGPRRVTIGFEVPNDTAKKDGTKAWQTYDIPDSKYVVATVLRDMLAQMPADTLVWTNDILVGTGSSKQMPATLQEMYDMYVDKRLKGTEHIDKTLAETCQRLFDDTNLLQIGLIVTTSDIKTDELRTRNIIMVAPPLLGLGADMAQVLHQALYESVKVLSDKLAFINGELAVGTGVVNQIADAAPELEGEFEMVKLTTGDEPTNSVGTDDAEPRDDTVVEGATEPLDTE